MFVALSSAQFSL